VQKHNLKITKGTRNAVFFKKNQKDVETSAKELAKLFEKAKSVKYYLKKAKDVSDPAKTWEELTTALIKTSGNLGAVAAKPNAAYPDAKKAFGEVKKVCAECHEHFRIDETNF
jgi:cytochrome c556